MRLIGTLQGEKEAQQFYSFLQGEGVACNYEPTGRETLFQFWILDEDDVERGEHWLKEFQKSPTDARFGEKIHPIDNKQALLDPESDREASSSPSSSRVAQLEGNFSPKNPITCCIILLCILFFAWNYWQGKAIEKKTPESQLLIMTPLMKALYYDMPSVEDGKDGNFQELEQDSTMPPSVWSGFYRVALAWPQSISELRAPLFVRIGQGEVWRLFTPAFLHGSFLHIFFNMFWLWTLGTQLEQRIKKWQYIAITLLIGMLSNTLQYLMTGPFFLGYSGIVCGLAAFIWMRQRRAPWEGYPLPKESIAMLAIFVGGLAFLQLIAFIAARYYAVGLPMNIANTAHIGGAAVGMILGRISFFSRRKGV